MGLKEMNDITEGILPISEEASEYLYDPDFVGWRPTVSRDVADKLLREYLMTYGLGYCEGNLRFIKENFHSNLSFRGVDARLGQVFSHLGLYEEKNDRSDHRLYHGDDNDAERCLRGYGLRGCLQSGARTGTDCIY